MGERCRQETCPMWDGHGCPCRRFDLDPDNLPDAGVFETDGADGCWHDWKLRPESDTWECEMCGAER